MSSESQPSANEIVQAAYDGDVERLRSLLAAGGDPAAHGTARHRNRNGELRDWTGSALGAAVKRRGALRLLLDAGAAPNALDAIGRAPLHYAALQADLEASALLLERGADPNLRDADEDTPLHFLGFTRNEENALELAKMLVQRGADPRAKNAAGQTAGSTSRHAPMRSFLQREAKKRPSPVFPRDPAHLSLRSDVERRIDIACRAAPRGTATHDLPRDRDANVLVYRTGKHDFARVDRGRQVIELLTATGWRAISFAEIDQLRLPVEAAIRAATAPVLSAPGGSTSARHHPILRSALDMALTDERPVLGGGPMPTCSTEEMTSITFWIAERALAIAPDPTAAAILELAHTSFNYNALADAGQVDRGEAGTIILARRAAAAAAALQKAHAPAATLQAMNAASRVVSLLREHGASVRDFLVALDQRILAGAMKGAARRYAKVDLAVQRVLWRETDQWVGELADGRFAFVGKVARKWTSQVGTRDEALACVPDYAFAAATDAVLNPRPQ